MFYRFQTFKDDSFPSTAISNQNRALHITLHSPLNRNDPSFWSSQIAVDSHFVCVWCVCICVSSRPFTLSSLLRSTEPHRDPTVARCRSASVCFSLSRSLVFGSSRKQTAHWASIARFPPPFYFFYTAFSHAAVTALGVGDALWPTKQRWIWRLLGTRTPSPLRYLPPKLNWRSRAGECWPLLLHCVEMYKTINIPFTVISAREFRAGCIVGNKPSTNSLCARCFNLICLYSAVWSHATFLFIREQWQVNDYILDLCRKARFLARLLPVVFLWMSAGWRSELTCLYTAVTFPSFGEAATRRAAEIYVCAEAKWPPHHVIILTKYLFHVGISCREDGWRMLEQAVWFALWQFYYSGHVQSAFKNTPTIFRLLLLTWKDLLFVMIWNMLYLSLYPSNHFSSPCIIWGLSAGLSGLLRRLGLNLDSMKF